jgi:predicted nuclease of predicted toxin-antitoxin system
MRVLTDENLSPTISHRLLALGLDVVCVHERGLLHREDWELMAWCIERQYAFCTKNRRHFEREHRNLRARGRDHFGILIVGDWTPEEIYWSLREFIESDPDRILTNQVVFLEKASPEFLSRSQG